MATVVRGINIVFGVPPELPLRSLPGGVRRVRVKLRPGEFARLYLKFDTRIEEWLMRPGKVGEIECWEPALLRAVNYRPAAPWPSPVAPTPENAS